MKKQSLLADYLKLYAADKKWQLTNANEDDFFSAVVIPVYAEKESIFSTLSSLANNPASFLRDALVICVLNNKISSPDEDKKNNLETINIIDSIIRKKSLEKNKAEKNIYEHLQIIADSEIKLAYIDACSSGYELPDNTGGVGLARKIGMDAALRMWQNDSLQDKLILSLDADTLVQNNYLSSIKEYFTKKVKTAIVRYEHQMPESEEEKTAIISYEIFLRYWVLALGYANSPYAYHSIGSTIITTALAYLEVRGMNKKQAGEDFYFLGKLAKIGKINYLKQTCVYPSARASKRVPFGTGKSIQQFLSRDSKEYVTYDADVFFILERFIDLIKRNIESSPPDIFKKANEIDPLIKTFLQSYNFESFWSKLLNRAKDEKIRLKQFHQWFDAFKTLKLINYLTKHRFPRINIFNALQKLSTRAQIEKMNIFSIDNIPVLNQQMAILGKLRQIT
jgi:hypothetical protein